MKRMAPLSKKRMSAAFQRHGPGGLAAQIANRLVRLAFLDQHHVWYVLDLAERRELPMPDGYVLRRVDRQDDLDRWLIDILDEIAAERLAAGNQLWAVERDGEPAFNCFIFFGRTPVRAASGRSLLLPPGTACLEDSVTAADHRGHGIAGAAWCAIAGELLDAGFEVLVTKVEVDNHPSRKAVEKAGFLPAAVMHLRRRGLVEHVAFDPEDTELTSAGATAAAALRESLVH
jgi:RimJ/RimL family protein N-acetyltransferase